MRIKAFFFLLFAISFLCAKADYFEGYIITLKGDTTKGEVDVMLDKKGLDPKEYGGIRFLYLEDLVNFKEGDSKKKYHCKDILGFGFLYNDKWYHFIPLNPKKNKIDMGEGSHNDSYAISFFAYRYEDGYLTLYKHFFAEDIMPYFHHIRIYIKHPELGYLRAFVYNTKGMLAKILEGRYKMEKEFVDTLGPKYKMDAYIDEILSLYNLWKKKKNDIEKE